jgi:hypothetical protein
LIALQRTSQNFTLHIQIHLTSPLSISPQPYPPYFFSSRQWRPPTPASFASVHGGQKGRRQGVPHHSPKPLAPSSRAAPLAPSPPHSSICHPASSRCARAARSAAPASCCARSRDGRRTPPAGTSGCRTSPEPALRPQAAPTSVLVVVVVPVQ